MEGRAGAGGPCKALEVQDLWLLYGKLPKSFKGESHNLTFQWDPSGCWIMYIELLARG